MTILVLVLACIGWSIAALLGVLVYYYWAEVGEIRCQSEHYRQALRNCDKMLSQFLESEDNFDWTLDPTVKDKQRPRMD